MADPLHQTTRWEIQSVGTGASGRGDIAARDLKDALAEGWEPFAVAEGRMSTDRTTITRQQDVEHALRMLANCTKVTLNSIVTAKRTKDIKWGATAAALQNAQRVIEAMDENDQ